MSIKYTDIIARADVALELIRLAESRYPELIDNIADISMYAVEFEIDMDVTLEFLQNQQIGFIEAKAREEIALGTVISIKNIRMKGDFNDALIVKEVAEWFISQRMKLMYLKDINRKLHPVTPQQGIRAANDIARSYMNNWTKTELLATKVLETTDTTKIALIKW